MRQRWWRNCREAGWGFRLVAEGAKAESGRNLAGTQWYVPAANLLAYLAPATDLSMAVPVKDQTLWDITSSSDGVFAGQSTAMFTILGSDTVSTASMEGIITPETVCHESGRNLKHGGRGTSSIEIPSVIFGVLRG